MKKFSESSELLRSRCFLEVREAFLEFDPDSVLALSLVLRFFDLLVEVFDLLDFLDLVEFFDLTRKSLLTDKQEHIVFCVH